MLLERGITVADLVKRFGVVRTTAHRWRTGEKVPSPEVRARMVAELDIPLVAWVTRAGIDPTPSPLVPPVVGAPKPTTLEECQSLLERIQETSVLPGLMPTEIARLHDAATKALALRARLEQQSEFFEDRVVREHPFWARIRASLLEALVPFPDAARAVVAAMEQIGA